MAHFCSLYVNGFYHLTTHHVILRWRFAGVSWKRLAEDLRLNAKSLTVILLTSKRTFTSHVTSPRSALVTHRWYWPKLHNLQGLEAKTTEQLVQSVVRARGWQSVLWRRVYVWELMKHAWFALMCFLHTTMFINLMQYRNLVWKGRFQYIMVHNEKKNLKFQLQLYLDGDFHAYKLTAFQGRTLKTRVSWKAFFIDTRSLSAMVLCCGEKQWWGEGMLQLSPLKESHIFLNERLFATRLQSCFSEKAVCPLASDISYRQAREGKEREQMRKSVLTTFSSLLFLHLTFSSQCGASTFLCEAVSSVCVSVHPSVIQPTIHPSQIFE